MASISIPHHEKCLGAAGPTAIGVRQRTGLLDLTKWIGGKMFRLLVLLAALLFVTPASAESAFAASIKRALTEAHCQPYSRGQSVVAALCRSIALRPVMGQYRPASLVSFEAMMEGNVELARKFDDGKITAEQYVAEIRSQWEEFAAKNDEGPPSAEREHRQGQCSSIIQQSVTLYITSGQEAAALENLQSLGCLK